jgi:hypothetical protein
VALHSAHSAAHYSWRVILRLADGVWLYAVPLLISAVLGFGLQKAINEERFLYLSFQMIANHSINRTAQKLRFWVPSALRAPAAGYLRR